MVITARGEAVTDSAIDILIDSDAFIAWFMPDDLFAQVATRSFEEIFKRKLRIATTSLVVVETATTLSNRSGQDIAQQFLKMLADSGLPRPSS